MVKSQLFELWKQKEIALGRTITIADVAKATGLARETIVSLRDGQTSRFDAPVLDKICEFFEIPAGPVPFIVYDATDDS